MTLSRRKDNVYRVEENIFANLAAATGSGSRIYKELLEL
jgi:hypothetical protein